MNRLKRKWWYIVTQVFYKLKFGKIGKGSIVFAPLQIDEMNSIALGEKVYIAQGAWLMGNADEKETITIGNGTTIGHFSHIIGRHSITIEQDVLIADKVFISDCTHNYEDVNIPVSLQGIKCISPVRIGNGSWIGENVCICGASVGKHCVIGANSVVNKDIPDYCVAVGIPAKVVKKYDFKAQDWVKV